MVLRTNCPLDLAYGVVKTQVNCFRSSICDHALPQTMLVAKISSLDIVTTVTTCNGMEKVVSDVEN